MDEDLLSIEDEDDDEDLYEAYRKERQKLKSAAAKREFFSGIKFQVRTDSIQVHLNSL